MVKGKNEQVQEVGDTFSMTEISTTQIQRKLVVEFQKEKIVSPDTPKDIKENTMV